MTLSATSCSSSSFCVAVGSVSDGSDYFPLVETYSQGAWSPTVLPVPANAHSTLYGTLYSVSCPSDGTCAAVGEYDAYDPALDVDYQSGLLESLTDGVWTPTEGVLPPGTQSISATVNSVSCSDPTTCIAVGDDFNRDAPDGAWTAQIYTWSSGSWQLTVPTLPSNYDNSLNITGISCPDSGECVAVGTYQDAAGYTYGLILTLDGGTWTAAEAPMPANVLATPVPGGGRPYESLSSVDCPNAGACLAGGFYQDSNDYQQPLLLQLQDGVWTASEAPVPSDAGTNPLAAVVGVSCPALGVCVATGYYDESGLILTQSNGTWEAASAPLPTTQSNSSLVAHADSAVSKTACRRPLRLRPVRQAGPSLG